MSCQSCLFEHSQSGWLDIYHVGFELCSSQVLEGLKQANSFKMKAKEVPEVNGIKTR